MKCIYCGGNEAKIDLYTIDGRLVPICQNCSPNGFKDKEAK